MKSVPEWAIQASWWVSGIFATGAIWYFLSVKRYGGVISAVVGALLFAGLAVGLHGRRGKELASAVREVTEQTPAEEFTRRYVDQPSHIRFLKALPKLRAVVYENAKEGWDTGATADMREASYDVIDFMEFAWLRLAEFYPPKHFGRQGPRAFIRNYIRDRFAYHWAKYEPEGPGTGGTIVGVMAAGDVIEDLEKMIADTVAALFLYDDGFNYEAWASAWRQTPDIGTAGPDA